MRARSLKPGIYKNFNLAMLGDEAFRLFTGLWCMADRRGRLKDEPEKIQAELFPFRFQAPDVDALLSGLAGGDDPFIHRYAVKGQKYIEIVRFSKHQKPHPNEQESAIPSSRNKDIPRSEVLRSKDITTQASSLCPSSSLNPSSLNPFVAAEPQMADPAPPYERPNPKTNPVGTIVFAYKLQKGFEPEDRSWDATNWARCMKPAKELLAAFGGDLGLVVDCIGDVGAGMEAKNLSWTLETVVRHCQDWKQREAKKANGTTRSERDFGYFAGAGSKAKAPRGGGLIAAGSVFAGVRNSEDVPDGSPKGNGSAGTGDVGLPEGLGEDQLEAEPDRGSDG